MCQIIAYPLIPIIFGPLAILIIGFGQNMWWGLGASLFDLILLCCLFSGKEDGAKTAGCLWVIAGLISLAIMILYLIGVIRHVPPFTGLH